MEELFQLVLRMNKEAIQLQRSILGILSAVSPLMATLEPLLKLSLTHLVGCLSLPLLKKEASDVLLEILEVNPRALSASSVFDDLLTRTSPHSSGSV